MFYIYTKIEIFMIFAKRYRNFMKDVVKTTTN